jgi:ribulose-phosphate 3-epimerase
MVSICPTVTADNPHTYREQIERVTVFAPRIHIDLSDGSLAPNNLISLDSVWWPATVRVDLHMMYRQPFDHLDLFKVLTPQLVIVHAEGKGDYAGFAQLMHANGIEAGVALLADTPAEMLKDAIGLIDHVMLFSGDLGHFGGKADLRLLDKAKYLKKLKPQLEIGWDGGINAENVRVLAEGGIEVLNVGGFIQRSQDPAGSYRSLVEAVTFAS